MHQFVGVISSSESIVCNFEILMLHGPLIIGLFGATEKKSPWTAEITVEAEYLRGS